MKQKKSKDHRPIVVLTLLGFIAAAFGMGVAWLTSSSPPKEQEVHEAAKPKVAPTGQPDGVAGQPRLGNYWVATPMAPTGSSGGYSSATPVSTPDKRRFVTGDYPRADLLIEAADVAKPEVGARSRVLDVRYRTKYLARHIAGAVWVDLYAWAKAFTAGQDSSVWEEKIGALGIDLDTPVIIYDDGPGKDAAHLWWILRYWGVKDVRLVNGGWCSWLFEGRPQEDVEPKVAARPITLRPDPDRLAQKYQMLEVVKNRGEQIIDARSDAEFRGERETARRNGAIPTATNLQWSTCIDSQTWRFKSSEQLAELFRAAGINPARPTITYCQSGDRAAAMAFALELMGAKKVRIYYPGWAEWGNANDTPLALDAKTK